MAQGDLNRRLSPADAGFLHYEDEKQPLNIGSIAIFQGEIPYDRFLKNLEDKLHLIPRYRQRVIFAPFNIAHPTWEFDPEFDIRNHIKKLTLDPPGTEDQLRELAAKLFEGTLSRDKPLWEIYLIHGIEGDRSALVSKVHHCLVDGVSGIELLMVVLEVSPDPTPPTPPSEPYDPDPIPDRATLFVDALFDRMSDSLNNAADLQKAMINNVDDPAGARSLSRALENAIPYLTRPDRRAPFNGPFSGGRRVAWSEAPFDEIRSIRKARGGTVNDVVLAVLSGALARYYEAHDIKTDGEVARIATPVNVRREDERGSLGNRISMLLVEAPLGIRNPIERLEAIRERFDHLKRNHVADGVELVADSLGNLPPMLHAIMGALPAPRNTVANLVCTNVPGPMIPLYSVGHKLLSHVPLVPIAWEMGVGCAVTSYNQRLYFALMADTQAAPDVDRLNDFLRQSYVELRSAAGVSPSELPDLSEEIPSVAAQPKKRRGRRAASESMAADAG